MQHSQRLERFLALIRGRATPARVVTEIIKDGWPNTGWSGQSCTTQSDWQEFKRLAIGVRRIGLDNGSALWRIFSGAPVKPLPLP